MITRNTLDISVLLAWLWMIVNSYVVTISPCAESVLTGTAMLLAYFVISQLPSFEKILILVLLIWTGHEVILGLLQILGIARSNHVLYTLTGTFDNPGPYGGFLAVMCPIFMSKYLQTKNRVWRIASLVCLLILPITWSRAAFLAVAVAIGCIFWKQYKKYVLYGVLGLMVLSIPLYLLKFDSANGRMVMAIISCVAIGQNLWLGSGINSYLSAYGLATDRFLATDSNMESYGQMVEVPGNAFCEILKIGVEQGMVGLLLWIAIAVLGGLILFKRRSPLFYGLISLAVFSCFSYPFDLWEFRILIVLFACGISEDSVKWDLFRRKKERFIVIKHVVCAFLLIFAEMFVIGGLMDRREVRTTYKQMAGMTDVAFLKDYEQLFPMMNDDPQFLFDYAKALQNAKRWNESNYILMEGEKVSADPMFVLLQGNNYQSMGFYSLADNAYKKAWKRVPNRLYPIYKNMMMHWNIGNKEISVHYAEKLLDIKPKIESPATREMQQAAKKIIGHR